MTDLGSLSGILDAHAGRGTRSRAVALAIGGIADACIRIADLLALGSLAGDVGRLRGHHADGDSQKELDIVAHENILAALGRAPVAWVGSEEDDEAIALDPSGEVVVAIDPLDGSSNIDTNVSVGTIFSILPCDRGGAEALLAPGTRQLAAGFFIYGPHTALALTLGDGTHIFVLDRRSNAFMLVRENARIPPGSAEYAVNASNYRHWEEPVRSYIDDCLAGADGPRGQDFNMRWIASMVAEAFRILTRGGVYLYPRDARKGYAAGRLRLVYEANPVAFLVEQAGGAATDGRERILDLVPRELHQRTPLVFGSRDNVVRVGRHHAEPHRIADRAPLFAHRGLFRV